MQRMRSRLRSAGRLAAALAAFALALGLAPGSAPAPTAAALSSWTGGVDLYRVGVFTTQQSLLWCTAADVQISRNIVRHRVDHSRTGQARYFDWMRARNRYAIPVSDGVDPAGWTAGIRHFVDDRYRLVVSSSFDALLRSAVASLRRTSRPVGLFVASGEHAWLLTGFTATADPAVTSQFTITSVRVVGPLYGLQNKNGYDMPPDTKLSPTQLKRFVTPWHYARIRMVWEGAYVSLQPVGSANPSPSPSSIAVASPSPSPSASPSPLAASPSPSPASSWASPDLALAEPSSGPSDPAGGVDEPVSPALGLLLVVGLASLVVGGVLLFFRRG